MPMHMPSTSSDDEPLEDTTAALPLRSKRTERQQRKKATRDRKRDATPSLNKLPTEVLLSCLDLLRPSDVVTFSHVNRRFHALVAAYSNAIGDAIIRQRYAILAECLPLPRLLADIDGPVRDALSDPVRQKHLSIHKQPYQHIESPDPHLVCTCLTCILTWNNLNLVLDFAHWQNNLDAGEPLPMVPRGHTTSWNQELVAGNASLVRGALQNSLQHARILERHLDSTVRAIRRHARNKGNRKKHIEMTDAEAASGTDAFLDKQGLPSLEFPYNRDEYYMLEAYLPNRWWKKYEERWVYTIAGHHERDLKLVMNLREGNAALKHICSQNSCTSIPDQTLTLG